MITNIHMKFPAALARTRNIYIWRFDRYEQAMAAAVARRLGRPIAGVVVPVADASLPATMEPGDLPVYSLAELQTTHGDDFLILFNLQCFFEVFAHCHDDPAPVAFDRFGMARIHDGETGPPLGVPEVMARIWRVFTERSVSRARDLIDAFFMWYFSGEEPRSAQISNLARHGTSYLPQGRYASILLANGELTRGWAMYEAAVTAIVKTQCAALPHRFWSGEEFAGRKVIFRREHGPGDEICYAGVFGELIDMGCTVVIECDPRLAALFQRSFPHAEVIARLDPPHPHALAADIDFQASFSAPNQFLRDDIRKFPNHKGYLKPKPDRVAYWRDRTLAIAKGQLRVGIGWSSRRDGVARWDVTAIDDWIAVLRAPNATFFCLQYDVDMSEIATAWERYGCRIHVLDAIDLFNDLEEATALIAALDLVIGVSSVTVQMAGATGTPAYEIVPRHWHMFLGQDYDPFYPSVRGFVAPSGASIHYAIDMAAVAMTALMSQPCEFQIESKGRF